MPDGSHRLKWIPMPPLEVNPCRVLLAIQTFPKKKLKRTFPPLKNGDQRNRHTLVRTN
jgi:hypothetical protein